MTFILLLLLGLLLWAFQHIVRRAVTEREVPSLARSRVWRYLPMTISVLWLGYSWLVFSVLFADEPLYPFIGAGLLLVLFALIGWYVLRDIVAGISFMAKHPALLHQRLNVLDKEGKVVKLGPTSLYLQTDTGEILTIPYNRIADELVTDHSQTFVSDRFSCNLSLDSEENPEDLASLIQKEILLLPWSNAHLPPVVRVHAESTGNVADITFHCLNAEHASRITLHLRSRYEGRRSPKET